MTEDVIRSHWMTIGNSSKKMNTLRLEKEYRQELKGLVGLR